MASSGPEYRRLIKSNCKYANVLKGQIKKHANKPVNYHHRHHDTEPQSKLDNDFLAQETEKVSSRSSIENDDSETTPSSGVNNPSLTSKTWRAVSCYPQEIVLSFVLLLILACYILILNLYKNYGTPIYSMLISNRSRRLPDFSLPNYEELMEEELNRFNN